MAKRALELRNFIKQEIETLNQPSDADVESSGIPAQLSNAGVPFPLCGHPAFSPFKSNCRFRLSVTRYLNDSTGIPKIISDSMSGGRNL